jgi:hypothetical protein
MTVTTVNPANGETLATYEETLPASAVAVATTSRGHSESRGHRRDEFAHATVVRARSRGDAANSWASRRYRSPLPRQQAPALAVEAEEQLSVEAAELSLSSSLRLVEVRPARDRERRPASHVERWGRRFSVPSPCVQSATGTTGHVKQLAFLLALLVGCAFTGVTAVFFRHGPREAARVAFEIGGVSGALVLVGLALLYASGSISY